MFTTTNINVLVYFLQNQLLRGIIRINRQYYHFMISNYHPASGAIHFSTIYLPNLLKFP